MMLACSRALFICDMESPSCLISACIASWSNCSGISMATEDAINELLACDFTISIIQQVEESSTFVDIQFQRLKVRDDLGILKQLIENILSDDALTGGIQCLRGQLVDGRVASCTSISASLLAASSVSRKKIAEITRVIANTIMVT
mmetsp:Transcript_55463/g.130176  ORF Transcript_55463/g.130176 Transcript_55463/m.130176 type:complete len:146 (+) Transcript_55463:213-650(+)